MSALCQKRTFPSANSSQKNWYRPSRRNKIGRLRWANWRRATGHKSPWEDGGEQRRLRHALPTRGGQYGIILRDQFIHSADDPHDQRFRASAHAYLAHRKLAHFDSGSRGDNVGYNQLTAIIFGQLLETCGYMY